MRTLWTITANDLAIYFRDRSNWVTLVLIPVAFTALLGWALTDRDGPVQVHMDVVDQDGSPLSAALVENLRTANAALIICPPVAGTADDTGCNLPADQPLTPAPAMERVRRGAVTAALVIPPGMAAAAEAGQPLSLTYASLEPPTEPSALLETVQAELQTLNAGFVARHVGMTLVDEFERLAGVDGLLFAAPDARTAFAQGLEENVATRLAARPAMVRYTGPGDDSPDGTALAPEDDGFTQAVPGMGATFVMLTILSGLSILLRERRQWTLQRLAVAPVRRWQLLGGKLALYFILGMVQFLVIFAVGWAVGMEMGNAPLALLAIMAAFVLCIAALTFLLGQLITSEGQVSGLSNLLALTLAPLGGAWWPLAIVPPVMATVGHLSPVAWAMDGFHAVIYNGAGLVDVLTEIGVLSAAALVLFVLGVRTFRVE